MKRAGGGTTSRRDTTTTRTVTKKKRKKTILLAITDYRRFSNFASKIERSQIPAYIGLILEGEFTVKSAKSISSLINSIDIEALVKMRNKAQASGGGRIFELNSIGTKFMKDPEGPLRELICNRFEYCKFRNGKASKKIIGILAILIESYVKKLHSIEVIASISLFLVFVYLEDLSKGLDRLSDCPTI